MKETLKFQVGKYLLLMVLKHSMSTKLLKLMGLTMELWVLYTKAQLVLTPYGAKQYIDNITDSTDDSANLMEVTNNVIDVYFVPSDNVKPVISFGNYNNHVVFLVKHLEII